MNSKMLLNARNVGLLALNSGVNFLKESYIHV